MEIRGERECQSCGARWSYYESGTVTCPECGSMRSVGVDERSLHTDTAVDLDLTAARTAAADGPLHDAADEAADAARSYVRERGFVHAGDLLPLDDVYVAATELAHAADAVEHALELDDEEERYFLAFLRGTEDGDRPAAEDVPRSMRPVRGLAAAAAAGDYRRAVSDWLDRREREVPPAVGALLERLDDHVRRVEALDGDVDPAAADRLLTAARELGVFLREDDDGAIERARAALDRLD